MQRCLKSVVFLALVLWGGLSLNGVVRGQAPDQEWRKPRALRPGDTIALIAPAGPIAKARVLSYAEQMEKAGYRVIVPKDLDRRDGYLAGTDEQRLVELNDAIQNPKVSAIFACRGGYGLTRILDRVDYAALRKHPKIVAGYSDLTALHLAIARKARVVSFHSPMPEVSLWRQDGEFAYAAASFKRTIFADSFRKQVEGYTVDVPRDRQTVVALVKGKARGRLVGGNLTLICSTLGTPYAIEPQGNILFFEDTGEAPYRIDRSLSQLRLAGVLDKVVGVVIGQFTKTDDKEVDRVLTDYFGKLKVPVIRNFPVGHVIHNATLPHGALVEVDADAPALRIVENPVALD